MYEYLKKFRITPRVVKADTVQSVSVECLDESRLFYDDLEYSVDIYPTEFRSYEENKELMMRGRDNCHKIICRPVNGVITFDFCFYGEQEWTIKITRLKSDKHIPERFMENNWPWLVDALYHSIDFKMYSLAEDLYNKRPFKGDLHIHTYGSDGGESPEFVASQYRKFGFDFISITDHYVMEPSVQAIKAFEPLDTEFKLFPGEEVHPVKGGVFHMVNFNGKSSVNKIYYDDIEKTTAEVEKIAETIECPDPDDKVELAWFKWMADEIRKSGGIAIYPHPYWVVLGSLNVRSSISEEIFKQGFCDVYEILGGTSNPAHNRIQVQINYDMRDKGYKYPIVASSDAHSSLVHGVSFFDSSWTVVFSENADKIPENIMADMSVAVDNHLVENKNVYGNLRLVKYTWFLIDNYYAEHDELCNASGQAILRYMQGDKSQAKLISLLEDELRKYNENFFGR